MKLEQKCIISKHHRSQQDVLSSRLTGNVFLIAGTTIFPGAVVPIFLGLQAGNPDYTPDKLSDLSDPTGRAMHTYIIYYTLRLSLSLESQHWYELSLNFLTRVEFHKEQGLLFVRMRTFQAWLYTTYIHILKTR